MPSLHFLALKAVCVVLELFRRMHINNGKIAQNFHGKLC